MDGMTSAMGERQQPPTARGYSRFIAHAAVKLTVSLSKRSEPKEKSGCRGGAGQHPLVREM